MPPTPMSFIPPLLFPRPPLIPHRHLTLSLAPYPCPQLPNFRDLSSAAPSLIRPSLIYRGSTPATLPMNPNQCSLSFLRSSHLLLDLRSRDERSSDNRELIRHACGDGFDERENHISLLNKRRIVWGLARALPKRQRTDLLMRGLGKPWRLRSVIVGRMDEGGLILLNKILVDTGAKGIGKAMNVVADGVEGGEGVYFYCSAGKDRTGLLAALILSVLGVKREDIITDYVKSRETWENGPWEVRQDYCRRLEEAGLTPLRWLGAPPEVMEETLSFIEKQYGGVEDYLEGRCAFSEQRMQMLKKAMVVT